MALKYFKFIEKKNLWFLISAVIICIGISLMVSRAFKMEPALNYGIDFVGGNTILLKLDSLNKSYQDGATNHKTINQVNVEYIEQIRAILKDFGLEKSSIQITKDNEVLIKTTQIDQTKNKEICDQISAKLGPIEILEMDFIGPSIGGELRTASFWIVIFVTLALLLYITWRFEFVYGVGALASLIHDALIVLAYAAIFHVEISSAFIAALLTILGYSLNDTIVIFDRIRENLKVLHKQKLSMSVIANYSITQTLSRTILTSCTTVLALSAILIFGGTTIKPFCLTLLIGIVTGTYSSIFIASPIVVMFTPKDQNQ